ncbi:TPA: hypothetical protein ACH3X2_009060 [Trebouxia sp. C0005]
MGRKRPHGHCTATPPPEAMQLDTPLPAKRQVTWNRPNLPSPQPQPNGFVYVPLGGTVLTKDIPHSVKGINEQLASNQVPEHLLIPADGRPRRPAKVCWMKGCCLHHSYASCLRLVNYLQRYPNLDANMPNEWVRPAIPGPVNTNSGHAHK